MNEPVFVMIERLHARLDDLKETVLAVPFELVDYDKKIDRIDDQVYLLEVEIEKKMSNTRPLEPLSTAESQAFDKSIASNPISNASDKGVDEQDEEGGFLSESAKEKISSATKTLNSLYRDSKETFGEVAEAITDIKETFDIKGFFKK